MDREGPPYPLIVDFAIMSYTSTSSFYCIQFTDEFNSGKTIENFELDITGIDNRSTTTFFIIDGGTHANIQFDLSSLGLIPGNTYTSIIYKKFTDGSEVAGVSFELQEGYKDL